MRFLRLLLFVLLLAQWTTPMAQADSVDRQYQRAADRFYRLYRPGKFRGSAENWQKTINQFQKIVRSHPGHRRAPQSLYNIGKLSHSLYKWNHKSTYLDQAIESYRALAANYPKVRIADDAQFQIGVIYEEYKKDRKQAYLEYQELIKRFPKGDFTPIAKRKLRDLPKPSKAQAAAYQKRHHPEQVRVTRKRAVTQPGPKIPVQKQAKAVKAKELRVAHYGGLSAKDAAKKTKKSLVKDVEHWSTANWSRMVINIADPVRFKYQVLPANKKSGKGPRMYLDLPTAFLPKKFKRRITANDGMIKQARIAQFDPNTVRVVLDLESLERIKVYPFDTPDQYKVIIDILGDEVAPQESVALTPAPTNDGPLDGVAPKRSGVKKITLSEALGLKVHRIIIDPGHGGKDPGASGYGKREKHLALQLAKRLRDLIKKKNPEVEVLMTRDTDRYLKLEARTAFANKHQGDLFISIHLNASHRKNVSGMETYYLNLTTDSYALTLAAKENQTSLRSISNLQGLLHDLMTHSKIQESTQLAHLVQNNTVNQARASKQIRLRNLGVKRAPFFVLLGAQMPSILVEAGFISNRKENKLLQTKQYQQTLAKGMYQGIYRYMDRM